MASAYTGSRSVFNKQNIYEHHFNCQGICFTIHMGQVFACNGWWHFIMEWFSYVFIIKLNEIYVYTEMVQWTTKPINIQT